MTALRRTICVVLLIFVLTNAVSFGVSAESTKKATQIGTETAGTEPTTASELVNTAPNSDPVAISEKIGQWFQVPFNLLRGYMHGANLDTDSPKNVELGYGRITGNKVNLRSGPDTTYRAVAQGNKDEVAYIIGLHNEWYKVIYKGRVCYIRSDYLELTESPYENQTSLKDAIFFIKGRSTGITPSEEASDDQSVTTQIIENAKKHLGTPYSYGGTKPGGFDCSGFTQYVFKQSDISLPRSAKEQYQEGTYVEKEDLQPGDLVFLANTYRKGISHVGIYIGDGNMIHASSSKGITISSLSSNYNTKHYYGSRRIV